MDRRENVEPPEGWAPDPHPWCATCCTSIDACACQPEPMTEAHIIRGTE